MGADHPAALELAAEAYVLVLDPFLIPEELAHHRPDRADAARGLGRGLAAPPVAVAVAGRILDL